MPGGPIEPTPPGSATLNAEGGADGVQLVTTGHRVPILYGRLLIYPDVVQIGGDANTPAFSVVISEGPIESVSDWSGSMGTPTVSLGSLSPTGGLPSWSLGLACAVGEADGQPSAPFCVAEGRLLFDPRIGTWGTGVYPDASHTAYSTNPALVMADLATFPQYGWMWKAVGFSPASVDWDSVHAAADWCDELISTVKRYEIGGLYLREGANASEWSETVGLHAGLRWHEADGLWRLDYDDGAATVAATVTEDHVVAGSRPSVRYGAGSGLSGQPNRFTAEWTRVDGTLFSIATVAVEHPDVSAGKDVREASVYRLHGFQVEAQARRALERIAAAIWSEVELDITLTLDFLHLGLGSRFTANLPSLGIVGVDWRVTRVAYDADSVQITANLYTGDTWTAPEEGDLAGPLPVGADDPLQGYLPSPPPPTPSAAPTPPTVLAAPPLGLVPVYRRLDATPADGDSLLWDLATRTVRFGAGGGGGTPPVLATEPFTATAGQTAFVLAFEPLTDGVVYVSRGGVVARSADWSLASSTVTFGAGLDAGTEVQIAYWRTAPSGASPAGEGFVATEGQTDFTLAHVAGTVLVVAINGVVQTATAWSIVGGTVLTLVTGPEADADVWISYLY